MRQTIKLANGLTVKVDDEITNDMELVDLLREAKEDGTAYSDVVLKIFGKEQRSKLYKSVRKDGIVPVANVDGKTYSIADAVGDVMSQLGTPGKN